MGKVEINTEDGLLGRNSHPETEINLDEGAGNSAFGRAQLLIRDPYDDNPFVMEDMDLMQQRNHKDSMRRSTGGAQTSAPKSKDGIVEEY